MLQQQPCLSPFPCVLLVKHLLSNVQYLCTYSHRQTTGHHQYCTVVPTNLRHSLAISSKHTRVANRCIRTIARGRKIKNSEPWINPSSLSDSLEAHRTANRIGLARDGIPNNILGRKQRNQEIDHTTASQWNGVKVLRFGNSDARQHKTRYGGSCPPLLSEWRASGSVPLHLRLPWLSRIDVATNEKRTDSARERLEAEVKACERYFSPSLSERQAALAAYAQIREAILQCLGNDVHIDLIGSRETGTDGPVSDLDINMRLPISVLETDNAELAQSQLQRLDRYLRVSNFRDDIVLHLYLQKAHVPLIIGSHSPSGLEFQIQCTTSVYDSLEVSKAFVAEYPTACVIFKIVKQMLLMRGLTQGSFGGLTSYPLLNMVVTSSKLAGSHLAVDDVASQFLLFLDFWSDFNFDQHQITFTPSESTDSKQPHPRWVIDPISAIPLVESKVTVGHTDQHMMFLEDPADPSNNLGRGAHSIKQIQACFIEARYRVQRAMQEWEAQDRDDPESVRQRSILEWCLGGDYTSYEEARWQLDRYYDRELKS